MIIFYLEIQSKLTIYIYIYGVNRKPEFNIDHNYTRKNFVRKRTTNKGIEK